MSGRFIIVKRLSKNERCFSQSDFGWFSARNLSFWLFGGLGNRGVSIEGPAEQALKLAAIGMLPFEFPGWA
jgi:hypothetical protein